MSTIIDDPPELQDSETYPEDELSDEDDYFGIDSSGHTGQHVEANLVFQIIVNIL